MEDGLLRKGPENLLEGPDCGWDSLRRHSSGVRARASFLALAPPFEPRQHLSADEPFTISLVDKIKNTYVSISNMKQNTEL